MSNLYTPVFYANHHSGSLAGARVAIPLLISLTNCKSVLDVGCGTGTWLHEFERHGITDILGIDGSYVQDDDLEIPRKNFVRFDLAKHAEIPVERPFDLAICMEVAEHLPDERGTAIVRALTKAAPYVCFSAAIPRQPGTGHISGRWQDDWVKLFNEMGYAGLDVLRAHLWDTPDVPYWYAQNVILYARNEVADTNSHLAAVQTKPLFSAVHPALFNLVMEEIDGLKERNAAPSCSFLLRSLPASVKRAVSHRINRLLGR